MYRRRREAQNPQRLCAVKNSSRKACNRSTKRSCLQCVEPKKLVQYSSGARHPLESARCVNLSVFGVAHRSAFADPGGCSPVSLDQTAGRRLRIRFRVGLAFLRWRSVCPQLVDGCHRAQPRVHQIADRNRRGGHSSAAKPPRAGSRGPVGWPARRRSYGRHRHRAAGRTVWRTPLHPPESPHRAQAGRARLTRSSGASRTDLLDRCGRSRLGRSPGLHGVRRKPRSADRLASAAIDGRPDASGRCPARRLGAERHRGARPNTAGH
jgi:hypothetical protein